MLQGKLLDEFIDELAAASVAEALATGSDPSRS
jgi:hypothetical protein